MSDDKPVYPFGVIPAEVFMDERLTLETLRVLGALYTFRDKHTSLAFPSRDELSSRCTAIHPSNISAATTKLVELGWLVKEGKGGNSRATRYTIRVPEAVDEMAARHRAISKARRDKRVAEQATVAQSATVAEEAIPPVAEEATRGCSPTGNTQRVAHKTTRIEQTNRTDQIGTNQGTAISLPEESGKKNPPSIDENPSPEDTLQFVCKATWKSYSDAYFNRYGIEPIRNAQVNTAIKSFCKKIPYQEAPHVAAFFVSHNDKYYLHKTHHPSLMSKDAEGLRTQWATGRTMTGSKATDLERTSSNADAAQEAIAMLRRRNGHATA